MSLAAEFQLVDIGYVRLHYPAALELARKYNAARAAIDPAGPATIERARRALDRLLEEVSA